MHVTRTAPMLTVALALLAGCAQIFTPQALSENFALTEGTTANHPAFIDGDMRTFGESEFPASDAANRGVTGTPPSEVVVLLPKARSISKIVVHSEDILGVDLLFETATSGWRLHNKYDGLKGPSFTLKPRGIVNASGVKLRIRHAVGDKAMRKKNTQQQAGGWINILGPTRAKAKIREIELFGPVSAKAKVEPAAGEAPAAEDSSTPEDLLLEGLLN